MKLLVFGATGPTGQAIVAQALARGHDVTAFVRNPGRLAVRDPRLRVVEGLVADDARAVDDAVRGHEVAASALGVRSMGSGHLQVRSMRNIVPAMVAHGVRRIIVVSAFGVGDTWRDAPPLPRLTYRTLLRSIFADKKAAEDAIVASGLDWTFAYPVLLTNGPRTGRYRVGERLALTGFPKIARADVADFVVGQVERPTYSRKIAVLAD